MMAAFTLAHLSDPHLPPLPAARLRDLAGKRALGYLNWTRNRHKYHRRDVLDALVADMQARSPDHIAITGDLVNLALEAEFAPSRAWLESVGTADRVTVIPGNHDAYVRATRYRFAETWGPYIGGDGAQAGSAAFPSLRRRGPLALISLSSAVPTAPLMATGTLGKMREAEQALKAGEWGGSCECVRTEYPARDLSILDLLPPGVSKGTALERLAGRLGVGRKETMAIGDNWNDVDMLEWAGQGVMMGNAARELRTMAKMRGWKQAPPNDQEGVAVVLEAAVVKVLAAKA